LPIDEYMELCERGEAHLEELNRVAILEEQQS
jgi:hypothetical protein